MARKRDETHERLVDAIVEEMRAYQREIDKLDDVAAGRLGISRVDARCLDIIHQRGPMAVGALADESGLSASSLTTVLDRLERIGYVRRVRDKVDRRRVFIEMTGKARRRAMAIYGPIAADNPAKFAAYSVEELEMLQGFFRAERESVAAYVERVRRLPRAKSPEAIERSRPLA